MQYRIWGRIHVLMQDGSELESSRGAVTSLPPAPDAWVVGDETVVVIEWQGG